jgi:putative oxidoreductase
MEILSVLVEKLSRFQSSALGLLRIVSALIFFAHGTQKILGFPASDRGAPDMFTLSWTAGILELIGGFLLIIGLFSRPVAFVLSGLMAFAYWIAHAPRSIYPILNGGDAAILYCFVFLYIVFAGPGRWSVDAITGRERA